MSDNKYPNSGSLNPTRDKRSERSPDWWGRLEVTGDVLEALNQGKPIRLSGWVRDGKYGEFISLSASIEQPKQASEAGEQKPWPSTGPVSKSRQAKAGTIEGNLALKGMDPGAPFDDDLPPF